MTPAAQPPDALHVRCQTCGAWCRAIAAETVGCAHCRAAVPVPEDVRLFIETIARFSSLRDQIDLQLPKVEAACAQCGRPMQYGDREKERCPSCGAESVAPTAGTVQILLGGVRAMSAFHQKVRQEARQRFPVAERIDDRTFRCGGCGGSLRVPLANVGKAFETCEGCGRHNQTNDAMSLVAFYRAHQEESDERDRKLAEIRRRIANIEAREAQIEASRPSMWPVLTRFVLICIGIALFCYIGYRIDVALE
ncbi:MAG: hypothetical protein ACXWUG_17555 [Polyangiales bacterium]